jgi:TetR/AcrR family transcriptional regulator
LDSRSKILEAAARLFAEQGFSAVSLREIADRVGITKPSLLYHFASKDLLREEVLTELFDHWSTRLPGLLRAVTTGEGQLEALLDELTTFFRERPDRTQLVVREILDRPAEMQRRIGGSLGPLVTLVADSMRKGQAKGLLRGGVDPEAFVLHMVGLAVSMVIAAPVVAPVLGGDQGCAGRQEKELRRMAETSLFSESEGRARAVRATANRRGLER